jgi:uncharacterized repeat protein (TIGR01451 family)
VLSRIDTMQTRHLLGTFVVVILIVWVASLPPARLRAAGPWFVAPSGNDSNDCAGSATACASINGALNKPGFVAGDTIKVASGTYTGIGAEVALLNKNASLSGGWDNSFTTQSGMSTLDGESTRRGVTINTAVVLILSHFTVTHGSATYGAGIFNNGGSVSIDHCAISGNIAVQGSGVYNTGASLQTDNCVISANSASGYLGGGGMYLENSTVTVTNSIFFGNSATYTSGGFGGGIMNGDGGILTLFSTQIISNSAMTGGGGVMSGGRLTIAGSTFSGNSAASVGSSYGGGLYIQFGVVSIANTTFTGNNSTYGAGIRNGGTLTLTNSTFAGNHAAGWGGGLDNLGDVLITNSTFSGNSAPDGGGGIASNGHTATLRNTVLANNTVGGNCMGDINDGGNNLQFNPNTGCASIAALDPKLAPLISSSGSPATLPLLPGSAAIDAGNLASCPATDERGLSRFGPCDIGAYELQPLGFSTKSVQPSSVLPGTPVTFTLTVTNGGATDLTNIRVTDTLPLTLSFLSNTLTATSGSYGYAGGVISWTNVLSAHSEARLTFQVMVTTTRLLPTTLVNVAQISGDGETYTRTANLVIEPYRVFLPIILRNYCADFFDTFSNPASGWPVDDDSFETRSYLGGEYQILGKQAGFIYTARAPQCDRQNYVVQADARWASSVNNYYGLLFGITPTFNQYYIYEVNPDLQTYRLRRRDSDGVIRTVIAATSSGAIQAGLASNHLKATRNGTQISLEVNGTLLTSVSEGTISGLTGAGLSARPYDNVLPGDARFDNFSVTALPGNVVLASVPTLPSDQEAPSESAGGHVPDPAANRRQ